jgi:hypothetical protein
MHLIKQCDKLGCGLACAAMAAGRTYREIRSFAFPDGEVVYTSMKQLREIMEAHGVSLSERLIPFQSRRPTDLEFDALLKVNTRQNGRFWHWVIWDYGQQKILDPRKPPYKRLRFVSFAKLSKSDSLSSPVPSRL